MNDRESLLRTIRENPDEDTPRLIFADWLDEYGDESDRARAEYIRLPVEINRLFAITEKWARTPGDEFGGTREDVAAAGDALAEAQKLQYHRDDLLRRYGAAWSGVRPGDNVVRWNGLYATSAAFQRSDPPIIGWGWHRGFINSIACSWPDLLAHKVSLLQHPIRRVRLTTHDPCFFEGGESDEGGKCHRVKCSACGGRIAEVRCDQCLNEWTCEKFPGIVFETPPIWRGPRRATFTGAVSSDLNDSRNWEPAQLPEPGDPVYVGGR